MFWYYFPPIGWFSGLIILLIIAICLYQRFPRQCKVAVFAILAIIIVSAIMNVIAPATSEDEQTLAAANTPRMLTDPEEISRQLNQLDAMADSTAALPSFVALQNKLSEANPGMELEPLVFDEQWQGDSLKIIAQYRIKNTSETGFVSAEGYKGGEKIIITACNMEKLKGGN